MLFLFDEPTTGLHFDDIHVLMAAFRKLTDAGHSLLIIEHNLDVIRAADWLIDIGPEGGDKGGSLVAAGTPESFIATGSGLTAHRAARYESSLHTPAQQHQPGWLSRARAVVPRRPQAIEIHHAREHNLKNIDVSIPLTSSP
jgi:excinuclease ABC subunit A